jgi:hypothetical protein
VDKKTRRLLDRIEGAAAELRAHLDARIELEPGSSSHWDSVDWARRQRPEWEPRGRLFTRLADEGGRVSFERWKELGEECGYENGRGLNGFFAGRPPVVVREGDEVVLTQRGYSGAAYWRGRYGAGKGRSDA